MGLEHQVGDMIKKGSQVGLVGSTGGATGSHLHLEVQRQLMSKSAAGLIDPLSVLMGDTLTQVAANNGGSVPKYENGTVNVPTDQLALLHRGEAVIPANQNPYTRSSVPIATPKSEGSPDVVDAIRWLAARLEGKLESIKKATEVKRPIEAFERRRGTLDEIVQFGSSR